MHVADTKEVSNNNNDLFGEEEHLSGDAEFKRRVCKRLGVPSSCPVEVVHEVGTFSTYGCDTWEAYDDLVVIAGDEELYITGDHGGLPRFISELNYVDDRKAAEWYVANIGTAGWVTVWDYLLDKPLTIKARIANALGREVVLAFESSSPAIHDGMYRRKGIDDGEDIINIWCDDILAFGVVDE